MLHGHTGAAETVLTTTDGGVFELTNATLAADMTVCPDGAVEESGMSSWGSRRERDAPAPQRPRG